MNNQKSMMFALGRMMRMTAQKEAANAEPNDVIDIAPLLKQWQPGTTDKPLDHPTGEVNVHNGVAWQCVTGHTHHGEPGWEPGDESALWAQYHGRDAAHAQPFKAEGHNPYMKGHWCKEAGKSYECTVDNTVWPPSVRPENWRKDDQHT